MISILNGRLVFEGSHLLEDPIKDFDGIVARYRNFDVNLMLHVVSDPTCRYESRFGRGRIPPEIAGLDAKQRFLAILNERTIRGNPKGFYVNKHRDDFDPLRNDRIRSVSLAYTGLDGVAEHFLARASKYGIIFFHDFLNSRGAEAVRYINEEDAEGVRSLLFNSPHLVESFGVGYDMRWENEWRIQGSLTFTDEDIAFVVVPDDEYHEFVMAQVKDELGDFGILPSSLFDDPVQFFLMCHSLEHHAWHQIEILGGMLVDFEMFPDPTDDEIVIIREKCGEWLDCLRKADIQEFYEGRYIARFLSFVDGVSQHALPEDLRERLEAVRANRNEPSDTNRDMMIACYSELFHIQRDRIDLGIP